jgi:hypothetical protein
MSVLRPGTGPIVPILGDRDPVALAPDVDAGGVEVDLLEDSLLSPGALGGSASTLAFHRGLLHDGGEEHPRAGMCRGSTLLNGITRCVSPMRFSQHPRTKLTNGDSPPVARRPRPSGAPLIVTSSDTAATRFLSEVSRAPGGCGANKALELTGRQLRGLRGSPAGRPPGFGVDSPGGRRLNLGTIAGGRQLNAGPLGRAKKVRARCVRE